MSDVTCPTTVAGIGRRISPEDDDGAIQNGPDDVTDPAFALALVRSRIRARRRGWAYRRLAALLLSLLWGALCWNRRESLIAPLFPVRLAAAPVVLPPVHNDAILSASQRRLTEADLAGRNDWELTLMRNEPYARHGFRFGLGQANSPIYAYFAQQPWYRPDLASVEACWDRLDKTERANARLVLRWQKQHGSPAVPRASR